MKVADSSTGLEAMYTLKIQKAEITIDCDSNQELTDEVLYALVAHAGYLARLIVDLTSFKTGAGQQVILDTMRADDGAPVSINYANPGVANLVTSTNNEMGAVILIFLREMAAMEALRDLAETITNPFRGRINVARAIETIRHLVDPNPDRDAAWASLRTALNLSKPYLSMVSAKSVSSRHGNHDATTRDEMDEITKRGWMVMNRFIELRKRALQSLPLDEFPEI